MFELRVVRVNEFFIKKYYRMFKGPQETVRDKKFLSYPVFELPGVNCMFNVNKKKKKKKKRQNEKKKKKKNARTTSMISLVTSLVSLVLTLNTFVCNVSGVVGYSYIQHSI